MPPVPTKLVPLGYGVGRFELELLRGAPQLSLDRPGETSVEDDPDSAIAAVASRVDLSFVPPPTSSGEELASSWAADPSATSSMVPKLQAQQRAEEEAQQAAIAEEEERFRRRAEMAEAEDNGTTLSMHTRSQPVEDTVGVMGDPEAMDAQSNIAEDVNAIFKAVADTPRRSHASAAATAVADALSTSATQAANRTPTSSSSASSTSTPSFMPLEMHIVVHSSIVMYKNFLYSWSPKTPASISVASLSFLRVLVPRPELVLIGLGDPSVSYRLPEDVMNLFKELRIGVEVMNSGNALATYNILTDEGRTVLAALLQASEPEVKPRKPTRSEIMRQRLGYWQVE